jgi:hypothetical protein
VAPSRLLCNHPTMKRSYLFSLTVLLASCRPNVADPPKNCAILPTHWWRYGDPPSVTGQVIPVRPIYNSIYVLRSSERRIHMHEYQEVKWNEIPVGLSTAETYLTVSARLSPQPTTVLDFPKGAPCRTVIRLRALMEKHFDCKNTRRCAQGFSPDYNSTPAPPPTPH